jgi:imidazolonepropionase-like amidohydrolase
MKLTALPTVGPKRRTWVYLTFAALALLLASTQQAGAVVGARCSDPPRGAESGVVSTHQAERRVAPRPPRKRLHGDRPVVTALVGGHLIDGIGGPVIEDATVVVRGDRIAAVGSGTEVAVPSGATVIDVGGATILPGFINAHVHSGYQEALLAAWAREGVTTVRDLMGPRRFDVVAQLAERPELALVVAAGPFVTVPGGYPIVPWGATSAVTVTTVEQARAAVDQLVDEGADLIKIATETGREFGLSIPTLSLAQARAIVETAHARGVPVSAHLTRSDDLPLALDAGVDDLAHMVVDVVSDALIARVISQGTVWVPTLELWYWVRQGRDTTAVANLARFVRAGGKVALGTDLDGYDAPFQVGMPMIEIEHMQQAGMTAMQIIEAATRTAAEVCGLESELGTLEAGKRADILVVDGNPLSDVDALTHTLLVLHRGIVVRDELSHTID